MATNASKENLGDRRHGASAYGAAGEHEQDFDTLIGTEMRTADVRHDEANERLNEPDRRGCGRSTQAERSARTCSALLESAARGLSRYGYGKIVENDFLDGTSLGEGELDQWL